MKALQLALIAGFLLNGGLVSAQWQWTDKDGRMVFSDRAPPSDVPDKSIVKRPFDRSSGAKPVPGETVPEVAGVASAASASARAGSAPRISGVDKELSDKKKKADEAAEVARKAQVDAAAKAKVENCARAKQAKANIDSGMRIARANEKGEREVLDDAARAAELKRVNAVIASECN